MADAKDGSGQAAGLTEADAFRELAAGEREVAAAWLVDTDVGEGLRHRCYRSSLGEALRLDVLAMFADSQLSPLECGVAVLLAETAPTDSVTELVEMARAVLSDPATGTPN